MPHKSDLDEIYDSEQDGEFPFVTDVESAVMSLLLISRVKEAVEPDVNDVVGPELECE